MEYAEKKYYDDLWEQDRLKKIEREEADRVRRKAMNAAVAATLEEQLNTLRLHAQEEVRLRQEEAALMVGIRFLSRHLSLLVPTTHTVTKNAG